MKYIKLFEKFTKEYQTQIELKDFKKIKKGSMIQYMGGAVEVLDNNGYVLKLKDDDGKIFTVNKSQFDHGGRISEVSDGKKKEKEEEFHTDVMYEAKNTIGLAFKEEQDYLDFKEFVAEQPRGAIRKNIGFDSKTKSWNVEMDVKVLDGIYGEGTPSDKKSGWYGGLPDDFESVIIESVTEGDDTIGGLNKMANTDLERIADYADMIKDRMSQGQTLDAWMYSKISDSVKNLNSVHDTMDGNDGVNEAEDYKYKKYVSKAFNDINDAMFAFRNAMGVKQLGQADKDLKKKLDDMQASIFALQKEMKSKGLTESTVTEAKGGQIMPGDYVKNQHGNIYQRVNGKVGRHDAYVRVTNGKAGKRKTGLHDSFKLTLVNKDGLVESTVNEAMDLNDPVLVAFRRTRAIMELPKFKPAEVKSRRISFDKYMDLLDSQTDIAQDIKDKAEEMAQTFRDMEQEAEPEGGVMADKYGSIMMKQEKEYTQLKAKKAKIDARIEKYKMS